jgi:integrase
VAGLVTIGKLWVNYKIHHLPTLRSAWRQETAWEHMAPHVSYLSVRGLVPGVFSTYIQIRKDEGASEQTINRELSVLSAIISFARKTGLTDLEPFIPKFRASQPRKRILSDTEIAKLLEACSYDETLMSFVKLALLTGQRREAIIRLKWAQINWSTMIVDFRDAEEKNAARMKGRGVIPITGELTSLLNNLYDQNDKPDAYVLKKWNGNSSLLRHLFKRAARNAGFTDVTPHTLRHTVASRLIRRGVPLLQVSQLLGHASIVTTERNYLTLTPSYIAEAAAQLSIK